ncbi:YchJ family protein [Phaeacidiphilus oryzae]|uniref:YchJ family protein n=1 Tax=Phaeacidiphilus oryzae TaxID=348818 RepID=UPI000562D245|nr:YchJ family protein [Phaeacidiphilus oryzae]
MSRSRDSRKARESRRTRPPTACPCGSGRAYADCCKPAHTGARPAPTAEALMRSRYSAFVLGDAGYLLRSWDPATRPARLELDAGVRWTGLEILRTEGGGEGPFHTAGTVEFTAHSSQGDLHEVSRFGRDAAGRWVYVDGVVTDTQSG